MLLLASGETCGLDASGNATCNGQDIGQNATSSAGLQTPTQGDTSVTPPGVTTTSTTSTSTSTTTSASTLTSTSSSSSTSSTSHSSTSTSSTSARPTTTGTGTTSAHSSSSTSSRGSAVGFTVPHNALTLLGLMVSIVLFVSHPIDHEDGRLIVK